MTDQIPENETLAQRLLREAKERKAATTTTPEAADPGLDAAAEGLAVPSVPTLATTEEKTFHVFYNTIEYCKALTETGRVINFIKGKFITDQQEEIDFLQAALLMPGTRVSVVKGKETQTSSELDPMAVLRKQHFEEFAALQAETARKLKAGEPLSQSESEVQALTPGSTADIADLAADSGQ